MGDELETREKLLESAMAEFSENGYMKASLRKICADAGVTTGALYFFFKNKNDLFKAIVDKPLKELCRLLTEHYMQDEKCLLYVALTRSQKQAYITCYGKKSEFI